MGKSDAIAFVYKPFKGIVNNFIKLFSGQPKLKVSSKTKIEGYDQITKTREQVIKWLDYGGHRPIFLVGPWGCGKTTHIQELIRWCEQNREDFVFVQRSFFGARSLEEGYLLLTTWPARVLIFLIICIMASIGLGTQQIQNWGMALYIVTIFLFLNRHKLIYFFASIFTSFRRKRIEVFILDDFDRSSIDENDRWAVLSNLYESRRRYIISIGYSYDSPEAKYAIYEAIAKLQGIVVEVAQSSHTNYAIAKDLDPLFPFDQEPKEWMEKYTPRQIIEISEYVRLQRDIYKSKNAPLLAQALYTKSYFVSLCRKYSIQLDPEKFSVCIQEDEFSPKFHLMLKEKKDISALSEHMLIAFFSAISSEFVKNILLVIEDKLGNKEDALNEIVSLLFSENQTQECIDKIRKRIDDASGS